MFKPGEIAKIKATGVSVTIVQGQVKSTQHKWPVATSAGVMDETELSPAHPTVVATAEGLDLSMESLYGEMRPSGDEGTGMSFDLREKVEKILSKASIDLNGHWRNEVDKSFDVLKDLFLGPNSMNEKDASDIVRAAGEERDLDRWVRIKGYIQMTLRKCPFCGEGGFKIETNGKVIRISGDPCEFPNGLPDTEWELNVPSGKLVVANDLREIFPLPEGEDFDINTTIGCHQTSIAYAANGMAHAFVGNSCPNVYQIGEGVFKIANPPSEEWWDGKEYVEVTPPPVFEGKEVASICTDLWWYSICDHAEFKRRCKHFKKKAKDFRVKVVKVKPGVYRFRHDGEARGHDGPGECVYTRFEWVRDPDTVKDFLTQYQEVEVNPNAYVHAAVKRWPTLYGKIVDLNAWQRVADHVFCTIGGGVKWHEKGFPLTKVDSSISDIDPPSFRSQYNWYPFSKPYGGLFEPKTLSPSFAKLAFRVLESVISFGTAVQDSGHSRDVSSVRYRMMIAVDRYRELAKQYPDQADPEYVTWLSQEGRAEFWVENFPLGPEFTDKHREHVKSQRWVPEDAYAVAFDANKLKKGNFALHPKKGGCWADKKYAQRYAILEHEGNGQPEEHNCFWTCHATDTSVPLYSVARVVKVGEVSHRGETIVEIVYDYGTPWMKDTYKRKALSEVREKAAIKVLSKEEYESLLPKAIEFFKETEERFESEIE